MKTQPNLRRNEPRPRGILPHALEDDAVVLIKRLCVWLWLLTMVSFANGASLQTLYSFSAGPAYPFAGLVRGRDGNFYGTTMFGGIHGSLHEGYGTVFRVTTNGVMTTLVSFAGNYGYYPQAGLIEEADGSFYGTTSGGKGTLGSAGLNMG